MTRAEEDKTKEQPSASSSSSQEENTADSAVSAETVVEETGGCVWTSEEVNLPADTSDSSSIDRADEEKIDMETEEDKTDENKAIMDISIKALNLEHATGNIHHNLIKPDNSDENDNRKDN